MRIGMLTGAGGPPWFECRDSGGCAQRHLHYGDEFVGFREGWRGVLDDKTMPLDLRDYQWDFAAVVGRFCGRAGRTAKKIPGGFEQCLAVIQKHKLDALIAHGRGRYAVDFA